MTELTPAAKMRVRIAGKRMKDIENKGGAIDLGLGEEVWDPKPKRTRNLKPPVTLKWRKYKEHEIAWLKGKKVKLVREQKRDGSYDYTITGVTNAQFNHVVRAIKLS